MSDPSVYRQLADLERRLAVLETVERAAFTPQLWTPTYLGQATPGATTYVIQQGGYVQIDKVVLFTLTVVWSAATGTGLGLFSLPLPVANTTNQYFTAAVRTSEVTFASGAPVVELISGGQAAYLRYPVSNAPVVDIPVEAAGNVIMTGWYLTT